MRDLERPGRSPVRAINGMVSTSNPLASQAALGILREGGNAVDAAIAAIAVLSVVETLNVGLGGDCFVIYAPGGRDHILGYNGSGRAPAAADPDWYRSQGYARMPNTGPHSVTVPGAVEAWARLVEDHGTRELGALLQPAIHYAEHGYPVHDVIAEMWRRASDRLRGDPEAARLFLPGGQPPAAGAVQRQPELAATLRRIARDGARGFYEGSIAAAIVAHLRDLGGFHSLEDFAAHAGTATVPISGEYRGYSLHECPPNAQGIAALLILGILRGFDLVTLEPFGADRLHLLLEAGRQAISDRNRLIGDPAAEGWRDLLDAARLDRLAAAIDPSRAAGTPPGAAVLDRRNTSYVAVIDRDLNAVSLIASIFEDFGSGLVAPGTGVLLQNRGHGFVLTPGHPNEIGPGKRPLHTIIPALLSQGGQVSHVLGVVGGHFQAWGHAEVVSNLVDLGLDPQSALDAPRFWHNGRSVEIERGIDTEVATELARRGHSVVRHGDPAASWPLGGGQLIAIDRSTGTLVGAADPRLDGCALGY